jgi:hypothetical protein
MYFSSFNNENNINNNSNKKKNIKLQKELIFKIVPIRYLLN